MSDYRAMELKDDEIYRLAARVAELEGELATERARHAREIEKARLEGKIETMTQVGGYADRITELRAAIAALEVKGE